MEQEDDDVRWQGLPCGHLIPEELAEALLTAVGGVTPDPQAPTVHLQLWQNMACAGFASAAYAVFLSTPHRMIILPVVRGACAHGLH